MSLKGNFEALLSKAVNLYFDNISKKDDITKNLENNKKDENTFLSQKNKG